MADTPIDVIILSYAKSQNEYNLTQSCIWSIKKSLNIIPNIIVVETNSKVTKYPDVYQVDELIVPNIEFNYNKFLNLGLKKTKTDYILISNNDVMYEENCLNILVNKLIKKYDSVCPLDISTNLTTTSEEDIAWYTIGKLVTGWSILFKKEILNKIGYFDEQFSFWYQDNDYANWLEKCKLKNALIPTALIHHYGKQSHNLMTTEELYEKTHGSSLLFENKWKDWDKVQPFFPK